MLISELLKQSSSLENGNDNEPNQPESLDLFGKNQTYNQVQVVNDFSDDAFEQEEAIHLASL